MNALPDLHGHEYKRITFYFPKGDEIAVEEYLEIPDPKKPGQIRDLNFKFCGEKLKKSAEFEKIVEEHIPPKFFARVAKSEKGIDIEICCDALKLASASRMERLFLFTNDSDFIPFCRTLKEFGANISILHLFETGSPNVGLLREADSYDVVSLEALGTIFLPLPGPSEGAPAATEAEQEAEMTGDEEVISEKSEAAASDARQANEPVASDSEEAKEKGVATDGGPDS